MTRQEIINTFKTELNKSYTIHTITYKNLIPIKIKETEYPQLSLTFDRSIIEAALVLLETENEI